MAFTAGLIQLSSVIGMTFVACLAILLLVVMFYYADLRNRFVTYIWSIYGSDGDRPSETVVTATVEDDNSEFDWWSGPGMNFVLLWLPLLSFIASVFFVFSSVPLWQTDPFDNPTFDNTWANLFESIFLYFLVTAVGMGLRIAELRYSRPYVGIWDRFYGYIAFDVFKFCLMAVAVGLDAGLTPGVAIINYFSWGLVTIYIVAEFLMFWFFTVWYWKAQREFVEDRTNVMLAAAMSSSWSGTSIVISGDAAVLRRMQRRLMSKFKWITTLRLNYMYLVFSGFMLFFLMVYVPFLYLWIDNRSLYSWSSWRYLLGIAFTLTYAVFYAYYIAEVRLFEDDKIKVLRYPSESMPPTGVVVISGAGGAETMTSGMAFAPQQFLGTTASSAFMTPSNMYMPVPQQVPSAFGSEGTTLLNPPIMQQQHQQANLNNAVEMAEAQQKMLLQTLSDMQSHGTAIATPNQRASAPPRAAGELVSTVDTASGTGIIKQRINTVAATRANHTRQKAKFAAEVEGSNNDSADDVSLM